MNINIKIWTSPITHQNNYKLIVSDTCDCIWGSINDDLIQKCVTLHTPQNY